MACRHALAQLLRPAHWHSPARAICPSAAAVVPSPVPLSPGPRFYGAPARRRPTTSDSERPQASWEDFFDPPAQVDPIEAAAEEGVALARTSPISSAPYPGAPVPTAPRPARLTRQQKLEQRRLQKQNAPPPLPPVDPLPSVEDLHPAHFSDLRLYTLRRTGLTPDADALAKHLQLWLTSTHRRLAREQAEEARRQETSRAKREALDLSWEWDRQVAIKSGVERTERELRKDAQVLRRLERRRLEKLEAAKADEIRRRENLDALIRQREEEKRIKEEQQKREVEAAEAERLKNAPAWKKHRVALRQQFPEGWAPPKRISREAMDLIRTMHVTNPDQYSTGALAQHFKVSPEAVRRILKSRFQLPKAEADRREARRREARKQEMAEGSSVWGGNIAAETREMESIRSGSGDRGRSDVEAGKPQ
ncbi:hypothetical protein JCM8202_001247 [Rhodotorula sphaerocarpa]